MNDIWAKFGVIFAGIGVVLAFMAFFTPEVRCFLGLKSDSCLAQPQNPTQSQQSNGVF